MLFWSWLLVRLGIPEAPGRASGVLLIDGGLKRSCDCSAGMVPS